MGATCPVTGTPGRLVSLATVRSLVRAEHATGIGHCEWFFCDVPECAVAYFSAEGRTLGKDALRVRVGLKEEDSPRPVCYCFGHTVEGIRDEVARTGRSTVIASITAKVKAGECACEVKNPKGTCCLGDVKKAVDKALADSSFPSAPPRSGRTGLLAALGSLLSAVVATACCWLPLLLTAVGVSAAGASAVLERARPFFLALAPILLGAGFYVLYLRQGARDACCGDVRRRSVRFHRAMLWAATAAVLVLALFPSVFFRLLRNQERTVGGSSEGASMVLVLRIDGLSCESCAIHVEQELAAVPGVRQVAVDFAKGEARVSVDSSGRSNVASLLQAVDRAGYRARVLAPADSGHR